MEFQADIKFNQIKWTVVGRADAVVEEKKIVESKEDSKWNLASDPNMKHIKKAADEMAEAKSK